MRVELSPKATKYLARLDATTKERIKRAMYKLSAEPPQGDIVNLINKDGFRLRIGRYRALFDIVGDKIIVYNIDVRGQIYKPKG